MAKPFRLTNTGDVEIWQPPRMSPVIYPRQNLIIDGELKSRGGAPLCCPIFGTQPDTSDYAGIDLPQHGQVRGGSKHPIRTDVPSLPYTQLSLSFFEPWIYGLKIFAGTSLSGSTLTYKFEVFRPHTADKPMPISFGWHPYFATYGENFSITCGDFHHDNDSLHEGNAVFTDEHDGKTASLRIGKRNITLRADGAFERFCIWTDDASKYICIEPVHGGNGEYSFLEAGRNIEAACVVNVS